MYLFFSFYIKIYVYFSILDMDVDQVHDMMDEIAEQQEVAKEIGKSILRIFEKI